MADKNLQYTLTLDNEQFKKAISEAISEQNKLADEAKKANKKIAESNEKVKQAQKDLKKYTAIATTALGAMAVASIKAANDFNEGFSKVATLIPNSTARIKELQENVLELSPIVGKTTKDLSEGLYNIISAFGDSADSAKTLELASKAATAGGASTTEAINLLSAVTKGYGNTSAEAQKKVGDLAFVTLKLGQTSMSDLASSIQRVTALSAELQVSQEELFAVFSSGTGVIGGAAEVSTKLQAVYTELMKPGNELAETFQKLGVATGSELIEKFGGLQGALKAIKEVADQTGRPINTLFGSVQAGQLALYATGKGAKKFASDLEEMKNQVDSLDTAFTETSEKGVNSFGFQLQQLKLNTSQLAIRIGQELTPSFKLLLTPVFKIMQGLATAPAGIMSLIGVIIKAGLALGVATLATATWTKVSKKATAAAKAFNNAVKANPLGLWLAGIVAVVSALKALVDWLERSKQKAHELKISAEEKEKAHYNEVAGIREKIKAWAELNAVENKNEKQKLQQQNLEEELRGTLGIKQQDASTPINKRKSFQEEILAAKEQAGTLIALETDKQKAIDETTRLIKERQKQIRIENYEEDPIKGITRSLSAEAYKELEKKDPELQRLNELLKKQKEVLNAQKEARAELQSITKDDFIADKKATSPTSSKESGKKEKSQKDRLAELEKNYQLELQLLDKKNASESEKQKMREKLDAEHYQKRLDLFKEFNKENVIDKGMSLDASLSQRVGINGESIKAETEKTYNDIVNLTKESVDKKLLVLSEAHTKELELIKTSNLDESQKNKIRLELQKKYLNERKKLLEDFIEEQEKLGVEYNNIINTNLRSSGESIKQELKNINDGIRQQLAEQTSQSISEINATSEKKFNAGEFGDIHSSGARRAKLQYQINEYKQQEQSINEKINALSSENLEKNLDKINALKDQRSELEKQRELEEKQLESLEKREKAARGIETWGGIANDATQGITSIATSIIGQKQQAEAQRLAEKLAEIEQEKNERLMELENEYLDWKEEKQLEQEEREEERARAEYERQQEILNRSLNETQNAFDQETNIQKKKNKEKELEEKRAEMAEAKRKKAEADAEKKRQKEERAQEIEMLNTKAMAQWQFQVSTIEAQNAAAQSQAQLARQAAQWEKAQSITSLIIRSAVEVARAAAAFPDPVGMTMHSIAAAIALAQMGVVSAAPLPSGSATPAPLPPAPRPIKFARGGIVYPSSGGTSFSMQNGSPAVAGEAGIPEIILPVTQENLESVFKAQGIVNNSSKATTISPVYNITITNQQGEELADTILNVLEDKSRDLYALIENTKQMNYIGE